MAVLQDTIITKLRDHFVEPAGTFNDLFLAWKTENSIDGWAKPTVGYQDFILAAVPATPFITAENTYWTSVYVP